uniref:Neuropeptide-Like Protein n=1 Tax=Strongyloides venezuelensis TaxID=75913 RepID=A0A0K0EVB4_STRVS
MLKIALKFMVTVYFVLCFLHVTESRSLYDDESIFYLFNENSSDNRGKSFEDIVKRSDKFNNYEIDFIGRRRMNRRSQLFVSEYNPAPCRWKLCANFY